MTHSLLPVIMAGGSGTRLWPLSRALYPKQFLGWEDKMENGMGIMDGERGERKRINKEEGK